MTNKQNSHRRLRMHPIHFHVGMYVAIAALLVTAMKTSEGVVASVYQGSSHSPDILSSTHLREAETHVGHARLAFTRHPSISGV